MNYYLGIDMGTSSIKASLINAEGHIIKTIKISSELINPKEGFYEIDPIKNWWQGFLKICSTMDEIIDIKKINAICISSLCGTFVPVDKKFNPLYNAILYGIDKRSSNIVDQLNREIGFRTVKSKLGSKFTTHSIIPKILWIKENRNNIYKRTHFFVESNNFITARLTGNTAWDYPTAAGSQLVNIKEKEIPFDLLKKYNIDHGKIPKLKWPTSVLGNIRKSIAKKTGLSSATKVLVGACDINAEAMATGSINPGDLVVVFGSTVSTLFTLDKYNEQQGFKPGMSVVKDTYRLGAATSSGGRFLDWFENFYEVSKRKFHNNYPTGIIILPYLDGARAPYNNPNASSVFFGIKRDTKKEDLFVAAKEALGYELNLLISEMQKVSSVPHQIDCMGGLINDKYLMQIIADITGKTLKLHKDIDASYGDAIMAMLSNLKLEEIDELPGVKENRDYIEQIIPAQKKFADYKDLRNKFNAIYKKIEPLF